MTSDPFVLFDRGRLRAFARIAAPGLLRDAAASTDPAGVRWLWVGHGESAVGLTWLGPGCVWDAAWAAAHPDELARSRTAMIGATPARHRTEFKSVLSHLRLGGIAGRVLYAVHRAVLARKSSLLAVADTWLAEMVWGRGRNRPRHWRSVLFDVLHGLTWLHVADMVPDGNTPAFGATTALLTYVGDLRGADGDACPGDCGARGGVGHHHFQVDVGPGFLGLMERFATTDGSGVRTYQFPVAGKRAGVTLRDLGKTGRLVSAFAPVLLGDPGACRSLTDGGHRVLQALVRETTRPATQADDEGRRAETVTGGRVKSFSGRAAVGCELLDADETYVAFNGNGKRKGMGFRLCGEWGWPAKAGYPADAAPEFLDGLADLAEPLGLTVIGVGQGNTFYPLSQLRGMAQSGAGRRVLNRIDVRVFAHSDYVRRWGKYFGWSEQAGQVEERPAFDLVAEMRSRKVSCRALARLIACDHSFLAKLLSGKKPWPPGMLQKARSFLAVDGPGGRPTTRPVKSRRRPSPSKTKSSGRPVTTKAASSRRAVRR